MLPHPPPFVNLLYDGFMQFGRTAIIYATSTGDGAMLDILLKKGGDINAKNKVSEILTHYWMYG